MTWVLNLPPFHTDFLSRPLLGNNKWPWWFWMQKICDKQNNFTMRNEASCKTKMYLQWTGITLSLFARPGFNCLQYTLTSVLYKSSQGARQHRESFQMIDVGKNWVWVVWVKGPGLWALGYSTLLGQHCTFITIQILCIWYKSSKELVRSVSWEPQGKILDTKDGYC